VGLPAAKLIAFRQNSDVLYVLAYRFAQKGPFEAIPNSHTPCGSPLYNLNESV